MRKSLVFLEKIFWKKDFLEKEKKEKRPPVFKDSVCISKGEREKSLVLRGFR
jgi:hypothetical protein